MSGEKRKDAFLDTGALRIMEALSGVDEELLERSRENRRCKIGRSRKPLWQQGMACAAVLCAAILGVMTWEGYQLESSVDNAAPGTSGGGCTGGAAQMSTGADGGSGEAGDAANTDLADPGESLEINGSGTGGTGTDSSEIGDNRGADACGNQIETNSPENESAGRNDVSGDLPEAGPQDSDRMTGDMTAEGCQQADSVRLTEEEARNKEILGNYIPQKIPEGYYFEAAFWNNDTQALTVSWSRGMDSIMWSLETVSEACRTADVSLPETYNVHLYEIPYGQTVPREYWEIFDHPVFAWEDFTLDIVKSRMASYNDSGDTDTPRGNFDVLLPEGVRIGFNGRGTVEQIWEMFQSMGL